MVIMGYGEKSRGDAEGDGGDYGYPALPGKAHRRIPGTPYQSSPPQIRYYLPIAPPWWNSKAFGGLKSSGGGGTANAQQQTLLTSLFGIYRVVMRRLSFLFTATASLRRGRSLFFQDLEYFFRRVDFVPLATGDLG